MRGRRVCSPRPRTHTGRSHRAGLGLGPLSPAGHSSEPRAHSPGASEGPGLPRPWWEPPSLPEPSFSLQILVKARVWGTLSESRVWWGSVTTTVPARRGGGGGGWAGGHPETSTLRGRLDVRWFPTPATPPPGENARGNPEQKLLIKRELTVPRKREENHVCSCFPEKHNNQPKADTHTLLSPPSGLTPGKGGKPGARTPSPSL